MSIKSLTQLAILTLVLLALHAVLSAHPVPTPWEGQLVYIKDERTKACFAKVDGYYQYGPYFTYVPCELLDKADWGYYERPRH
jgi:hypothetical protein